MFTHRPKLSGVLIGLCVTVLCTVCFFRLDAGRKLELQAFDWRMRHCNDLRPTAPIVHIDIDDGALERVGRWPWRRDRLADVLREINALGARYVVVDLLLSEHEEPYLDDPRLSLGADLESDLEIIGEVSHRNWVLGDLELAESIRSAGNVLLALQVRAMAPDQPDPLPDRLLRWWEPGKSVSPTDAIEAFHLEDTQQRRTEVRKELLRIRIRNALLEDFTLTEQQLAERLKFDVAEIAAVIAGAKAAAANERVADLFAQGRTPSQQDALGLLLGPNKDRNNPDRMDALRAYWTCKGLAAAAGSMRPMHESLRPRVYRADRAVPPFYPLAEAARGLGAVNLTADADNGVRRVPIAIRYQDRAVLHLGLAAACNILALDADGMTVSEDQTLAIPYLNKPGLYTLPLDARGNLIIHWTRTARAWRTDGDFPHISAAKVWAVADARRQIKSNRTAINYLLADVIAMAKGEFTVTRGDGHGAAGQTVSADRTYRQRVNRHIELCRSIHLAGLRRDRSADDLRALQASADELRAELESEQRQAVEFVRLTCEQIDDMSPEQVAADPEFAAEVHRFRQAERLIKTEIPRLREANQRLVGTIRTIQAELGDHIRDKVVFIGYAATAQGDIVATPIDPRTNGVMCHAHVLNALLQRRFITPADPRIEIAVCLLFGAVVSLVTSRSGPRFALLTTLGLMAVFAFANAYLLFMRLGVWAALVAPVGTVFFTWAVVTLYRQLTAERQKRFFARQLSQYTAPAIAAKIAESPEAARAFKTVQTREVTCFFSDLAGFTTLTEQEDAENVQYVLNTYLACMSQAIWSRHGLVNKFMGDGIMAFFNSSVDPLPDHTRAACETGLGVFHALERLRPEQKGHPASRIFDRLRMRVGIATGICKNGDMGSDLKADYTVIGDVVNLAARLEPANKVFGTSAMVAGSTRDAVGDAYEFRYLARLQVMGKARTVPAYELVCRKGELSDARRAYIERFEAGVALYQERQWDACIAHFSGLLGTRPNDLGARRYIEACQALKAFPPDDAWTGALELKEK